MKADKIKKVQDMETWLLGRDIMFKSLQNGHMQIFDPRTLEMKYQLWVTTEKLKEHNPQGEEKTWIGLAAIKNKLRREYE